MALMYSLSRVGVHECGGWSIGPVPVIYNPDFYWPEGISYKVFHFADPVVFAEIEVPEEWAYDVGLLQPYNFLTFSLSETVTLIAEAALRRDDSLECVNALLLLNSLNFFSDEDFQSIITDPQIAFWRCSPGMPRVIYGSRELAEAAGYLP